MKFVHFPLAIAAAVLFVSCAGKSDENTPLRVLSLGEPVTTNPLGLDHCKPAESADVLASRTASMTNSIIWIIPSTCSWIP